MSEQANAWILSLGANLNAAIGEREMLHLVDEPELFDVPDSPGYCSQAIVWQGEVLPVINLAVWLDLQPVVARTTPPIIGVVAFQDEPGALPQYGGLLLDRIPIKKLVDNSQACELPEPRQLWRQITISCFSDNGRATPILDLPRIFAATASQAA